MAYHSHTENAAEKEFPSRTVRPDSAISRAVRSDPASLESGKADRKDRKAGASAGATTPMKGDLTSEIDAELVDQMLESKRAEHAHAGRS